MRKYLLSQNGNFYKANLHCHTVLSDGAKRPEEVKEIYQELGYSVVAYTDHDILVPHNDLTDENFLALNGFEMSIIEDRAKGGYKICHLCIIALDPENIIQPFWHRELYLFGNAPKNRHLVKFDENEPDYVREYTGEAISYVIQGCREKGFFITYNHPTWSRENYNDYMSYNGMHAMEIVNGGSLVSGYEEYNAKEYDDMLTGGKKIYCIAADDNHNRREKTSRYSDAGVAFTMIKAEKLEYETITKALTDGHFYASQGPEIHSLWFEDGKIHITCSPADRVYINTGRRRAVCEYAENGELLTEVTFRVDPKDVYVRITVIDEKGYPANTNAYFTDELFD